MIELTECKKPVFEISLPTIGKIKCKTCSRRDFIHLRQERDLYSILSSVTDDAIPEKILKTALRLWAKRYLRAISKYIEDNKDFLTVPTDGSEEKEKCRLSVVTMDEKLVSDYTKLDFIKIGEINIIDYMLILSDAYKEMIFKNKPKAVEYLNGCWCYMHDKMSTDDIFTGGKTVIKGGGRNGTVSEKRKESR